MHVSHKINIKKFFGGGHEKFAISSRFSEKKISSTKHRTSTRKIYEYTPDKKGKNAEQKCYIKN